MQPFAVNVRSLIKPGLTFPADGSNVKVEHVYNDGCAELLTKLWLTHDNWRGTLVICPRCQGAARGLHHAPNRRGLCCVDCLSRLKSIEDRREAWGSSRKRKPVEKLEISTDKPADVSGSGSTPAPGKKSFSDKKEKFSKTSIPAGKVDTRKKVVNPRGTTNATRLRQNATHKKGTAKRRRTPAREAA